MPLSLNIYWLVLVTCSQSPCFWLQTKANGKKDQHGPIITTRKIKGMPPLLIRSQESHLCIVNNDVYSFICALAHPKRKKKKIKNGEWLVTLKLSFVYFYYIYVYTICSTKHSGSWIWYLSKFCHPLTKNLVCALYTDEKYKLHIKMPRT